MTEQEIRDLFNELNRTTTGSTTTAVEAIAAATNYAEDYMGTGFGTTYTAIGAAQNGILHGLNESEGRITAHADAGFGTTYQAIGVAQGGILRELGESEGRIIEATKNRVPGWQIAIGAVIALLAAVGFFALMWYGSAYDFVALDAAGNSLGYPGVKLYAVSAVFFMMAFTFNWWIASLFN